MVGICCQNASCVKTIKLLPHGSKVLEEDKGYCEAHEPGQTKLVVTLTCYECDSEQGEFTEDEIKPYLKKHHSDEDYEIEEDMDGTKVAGFSCATCHHYDSRCEAC